MAEIKITEIRFRNTQRSDGIKAHFDIELDGQPIKYCRYRKTADGRTYVMGPSMKYTDGRAGYFAPVPLKNKIADQILTLFESESKRMVAATSSSEKVTIMRAPVGPEPADDEGANDAPAPLAEVY